jgi:UDP-N-acetylmuramyl tripeptide synthase
VVELANFKGQEVTYKIDSKNYITRPKLSGQHNFQNGAAALALATKLLPNADKKELVKEMAGVSIAFGRGESYRLKNGAIVELVLVKNPASFRQALASYAKESENLMIAINDNIADGRDTSWLWDVDFMSLEGDHFIVTSGKRAADMALRLKYDEIKVNSIRPELADGLLDLSNKKGSKVILATYTAMLSLYKYLNKVGVVS